MSRSDENQNPLLLREKWPYGRTENDLLQDLHNETIQQMMKGVGLNEVNSAKDSIENRLLETDVECIFPKRSKPPRWFQRFATKRTFLLVFCISSVLQGMYYTYFVSVLTTIERLFQIRSQTTGVIMSATEVGQIGGGLLLSYFGGGGHRPRWIASGMILFAFSAFLSALPHFLFGDVLLKEFLDVASSRGNPNSAANICIEPSLDLERSVLQTISNITENNLMEDRNLCQNSNTKNTKVVLGLFFISLLGVGIGQTTVYNLGIPFIDDNVASEESPTYFGTTIGVRIFGPTLGFLLGSLCTRLSVDPFSEPRFEPTDPRWIGAWWLGHLVISISLILTSFIMMMFPKKLPAVHSKTQTPQMSTKRRNHLNNICSVASGSFNSINSLHPNETCFDNYPSRPLRNDFVEVYDEDDAISSSKYSERMPAELEKDLTQLEMKKNCDSYTNPEQRCLKDFLFVVRRLLTNKVLILRTTSSVLHLLPIAGLYTFLPKYLETQFRLPVHSAAMISGVGGILVMGAGIFFSGFVIRKLNPPPKVITGWIAVTALLYSVGMVILMFLGCSHGDIKGRTEHNGTISFRPICERTCSSCDTDAFAPICSSEGTTYFSACHAGCTSVAFLNNTDDMLFAECECLGQGETAKLRLCDMVCPNLVWYVAVFCLIAIIHSTSEVGGMLVTLRCVRTQDKAMALGLISVAVGLFGNVPCPILYGAVIDNACIHWRESCNERGACQIYDPNTFRIFFHGTTASVMLLAFVVDLFVWHHSKDLSFVKESPDDFSYPQRPQTPIQIGTLEHTEIISDNEAYPCYKDSMAHSSVSSSK